MYYPSTNANPGTTSRRNRWLAMGSTLAAALILLLVVAAACHARSDDPALPTLGAPGATPSPGPTTTGQPNRAALGPDGGALDGGAPDGGGENGGGSNSGGAQSGGSGGEEPGPEQPEQPEQPEVEEPAGPLSVKAAIGAVTPNGHCSAAGTITVEGGQYPVTVKFQWRALAIGQGWDGVAVSPVQSHTFDGPGGISTETHQLPEDGTNVFLTVTSPVQAGSGLAGYNGCSGQAGGGTFGS